MKERKRFDYRHIICIGITLGCLACTMLLFNGAVGRLIEGCRDLGLSIAYYYTELFGFAGAIAPTVNTYPKAPFFDLPKFFTVSAVAPLPEQWQEFTVKWKTYWQLWASKENIVGYCASFADGMLIVSMALSFVLPLVLLAIMAFKRYLEKGNNDYNKDSKPLRAWKCVAAHVFTPVKRWFAGMRDFIAAHRPYPIAWLCIWAFNFNLFTVLIEFFAYLFYFAVSFDFASIYRQVYKLLYDLSVPFVAVPWWLWAIAGLVLFDRFRKKIAYARLEHFEMRNRGFINARPIVFLVCGTMGKKKTTMITDIALSQEVMFRDKAFEKLLENDLKFPYFPWIDLENELRRAMEFHQVYNLATVRRWIAKKTARWEKRKSPERLFGYDYDRYGTTFDDKLKETNVFDVIATYAQLYFIYVIQSSLLISNYSVRVDSLIEDVGNFPLRHTDFFRADSRRMQAYSRHAHILDFDALRLGRKVVDNNRNADSFEFGVILITEVGKERGNILDNRDKKRQDETANQNNDLFDSWLKMVRHSATVDNFPFVRVIADEQRPESWGANARDLCEIVHIRESGETCLAMPFFALGELLHGWLFGKFSDLYYRYRFIRSDNTLPMYLLKGLTAKVHAAYRRVYNRFGYCALRVQVESGTQDGVLDEGRYYLMTKKIYSDRFSTDCFSDFFTAKALRSPVGIDDLPEYTAVKASFDELREQNSYFVNDLFNGLK